MIINDAKTVMVLAPHTDDGELGCGGTIARLIEEGKEVIYVAFSACEKSVPPQFPTDILRQEVKQATQVLGIKPKNLFVLDYEVREFPAMRQPILEDMLKFRNRFHPDLVFIPVAQDIHQDHAVIAQEGIRAFKAVTLLGYELPWNNITFNSSAFIKLKEIHLNKKSEALDRYQSQAFRSYANGDFLYSLARVRGTQIGVQLAEAFEIIRWIY